MLDFLEKSDNFSGITFRGSFHMDLDDLRKIYSHYTDTGQNLIDDYCRVMYESWEDDPSPIPGDFCKVIRAEKLNEIRVACSKMRQFGLFDRDLLRRVEYNAKCKYKNYQKIKEREVDSERRLACGHTSKKDVRQKVFELHGNSCLRCGGEGNITIDHVIPVARGGENCIDNYQPLCLSCNAQKGTKTTDYRNNE